MRAAKAWRSSRTGDGTNVHAAGQLDFFFGAVGVCEDGVGFAALRTGLADHARPATLGAVALCWRDAFIVSAGVKVGSVGAGLCGLGARSRMCASCSPRVGFILVVLAGATGRSMSVRSTAPLSEVVDEGTGLAASNVGGDAGCLGSASLPIAVTDFASSANRPSCRAASGGMILGPPCCRLSACPDRH